MWNPLVVFVATRAALICFFVCHRVILDVAPGVPRQAACDGLAFPATAVSSYQIEAAFKILPGIVELGFCSGLQQLGLTVDAIPSYAAACSRFARSRDGCCN